MARNSPVLAIGIDAANPDLIRRWANEGVLPNIRSLLAHGLLAESTSVEGFHVGSTWPSLYTGTSPASHGLHYLRQLEPGSYRFHRMADGDLVRREPFWKALDRAGRKVAILDVPLTRLDPSLRGTQIVEWGGHDAVFGFRTHPASLESEVIGRYGVHPGGTRCDAVRRNAEEYEHFIAGLEQGARTRGRLTVDLLSRGPWDFFMQVFTESHCVGHQCWHLHDTGHPAHDPAIAAVTGDPLRRVYAAIDQAIGEVLNAASEPAVTLLVIGHGMSHRFGASFLLPEILIRLGVSEAPPAPRPTWRRGAASLWQRLPRSVKTSLDPLRRLLSQGTRSGESASLPAHFQRSRCFPVANGLAVGGIRLNLRGREPAGIIEQGREAIQFSDSLAADLTSIIDERTSRPLIKRVLRTSRLYQGEHLDALPDLLVEWDDEIPLGNSGVGRGRGAVVRGVSPKIGMIEGVNDYGRTGEHRMKGMLVAGGAGISPGVLSRTVSILDFAPTVAALLGIPLPDTDGTVISEIASPASSPENT